MKVKYLNPISVKGVLTDIGNYLYEILDMTDRELMYDRSKFDRQHLIDNWEAVQKKPDSFSQDLVYEGDAYSLALEIAQLILFRRKIRTHPNIKDSDDYGFPKGSVPRSFSFDTDWDSFMLTLVGQDTAALTALVAGQVNSYSGASMSLIISKIQSITSSIVVQYNLMYVLLNRGLQVACVNGGDNIISGFSY